VRTAELNLGYTKIYAPVSGVIGRMTVELGQRIQPGQSLLAIVPLDDVWVTADFKETQLKYMRPGQSVSIHVDTFGRDYRGTVENLPGAAEALFSLLPPDNASGQLCQSGAAAARANSFRSRSGPSAPATTRHVG